MKYRKKTKEKYIDPEWKMNMTAINSDAMDKCSSLILFSSIQIKHRRCPPHYEKMH